MNAAAKTPTIASLKKPQAHGAAASGGSARNNYTADASERHAPAPGSKGYGTSPDPAPSAPKPKLNGHLNAPLNPPDIKPHASPTSSGGGAGHSRAELVNDSVSFSSEARASHDDQDSFVNPFDAWN